MQLSSSWWTATASYFVGQIAILILITILPGPKASVALPGGHSWVFWTGGLFGAFFIASAIFMLLRLAAATAITLIVLGQMIGALLFDHFWIFGIAQRPINVTKIVGAALLVLGVVIIRA